MLRLPIDVLVSPIVLTITSLAVWGSLLLTLGGNDSICQYHSEQITLSNPLLLQVCFAEICIFHGPVVSLTSNLLIEI